MMYTVQTNPGRRICFKSQVLSFTAFMWLMCPEAAAVHFRFVLCSSAPSYGYLAKWKEGCTTDGQVSLVSFVASIREATGHTPTLEITSLKPFGQCFPVGCLLPQRRDVERPLVRPLHGALEHHTLIQTQLPTSFVFF